MLSTERLTLRVARDTDLDDVHRILSDEQAMRYWSTPPHPDRDTTAKYLAQMLNPTPPVTYFMFELDSTVVGMGGLHQGTEIGYIIRRDHWRKGIAREATEAIIPYLWQITNIDQLTADVDPLNTASTKFLTALGFKETHRAKNTFYINGVWSDSVYFALARPTERTQA